MTKWILLFLSFQLHAAPSPDPICAKAPIALHKGPGTQFPVSWKVGKFMPFMKLETKNGWVKLQDMDGEIHWAQPRDLSTSLRCVVVKSQVATLRKEPSANGFAEIKTLDRYTPLKKLEAEGEWIHVEYEGGGQAWIHESNVWKPAKISSVTF